MRTFIGVNAFAVFLSLIGLQVTFADSSSSSDHSHGADQHDAAHDANEMHGKMHAQTIDLSDMSEPPSLSLKVTKDTMSGWNLNLQTKNFVFAPDQTGGAHVPGYGHAHLYIDGVKVSRLYGEWVHIGALSPGEHVIRVTLNANTHEALTLGEDVIASEIIVYEE